MCTVMAGVLLMIMGLAGMGTAVKFIPRPVVIGFTIGSRFGGIPAELPHFDKISAVTENLHTLPPVVILRLRNMTALDATGLFAIEEVARALQATNRVLILCGAHEQPASLIHQAEFEEVVGAENICDNVQAAIRRAQDVHDQLEAAAIGLKR
jgi:MFS superfamily sulfate permease-like transporter